MITGDEKYGIPQKIVLVITSRKSKVIELLNELSENATSIIGDRQTVDDILWNTSFDLEEFEKSIPGEKDLHAYIYQRSVICTNAFIEKYHQYRFDPSDPTTHLWNRFDVIVWDEPHSLVMDSSYQSAPYHMAGM